MNELLHEEMRSDLASEALELLAGPERARLSTHLDDCVECQRDLGEYRDAAALLGELVPARRLDDIHSRQIRDRLLARAAADLPAGRDAAQAARRVAPWTGWMVAAGLSVLLLTHHSFHRPVDFGWLTAALLAVVLLGAGILLFHQRREIRDLRGRTGAEPREAHAARDRSGPR